MIPKINTVVDLCENAKFNVFAPYFFGDYRTELSVAKKAKVDRLTIANSFRKKFGKYIEYDNELGYRPYKIKIKLLVDYFASILDLNREDSRLLTELLSDPRINKALVKNNQTLDSMKKKVILLIVASSLFGLFRDGTKEKIRSKNDDVVDLFNKVGIFSFFVDFIPSDADRVIEDETVWEHENVFGLTREEIKDYAIALLDYSDKITPTLLEKFTSIDIPLKMQPVGWYALLNLTLEELFLRQIKMNKIVRNLSRGRKK